MTGRTPPCRRVLATGRHERLEPCAGKSARTVLRGGSGGNVVPLPDPVSASAVRAALWRHRIPPAPQRRRATIWRAFIRAHKDQLLACDFFTVETVFLK